MRALYHLCAVLAAGGSALAQFGTPTAPVVPPSTPSAVPTGGGPGGSFLGGSDDCSTPDLIAGQGAFAFDTSAATTGAEGQVETACDLFGTTGIESDVWFEWTADADGIAVIQSCGSTGNTKIAAYPAGACPLDGTALICDDDSCGLQSRVQFACTNGTAYLLQVGSFPGAPGAPGSLQIGIGAGLPNDDCSTPTVIVGAGPHPFDNSLATAGLEGQNEFGCTFFGSSAVDHDVWYEWTAPATGTAVVQTCGLFMDTKLVGWPGGACPVDDTSLGCNDDECGLASVLRFPCTASGVYLLQVGTYPGAMGGAGDFTIQVLNPPAHDDCSTPAPITGQGTVAYDTTLATTGSEGQSELSCFFSGTAVVEGDLWLEWTADSDGTAVISTCGVSSLDTRLAVYPAGQCPQTGDVIACADDSCGVQTSVSVPGVTAGSQLLIQVGTFPGSTQGSSALQISIIPTPSGYALDQGVSSTSAGLNPGGGTLWMHSFEAQGGHDILKEISTAFGSPGSPPLTPGQPATIALWDDPNNDLDPSDSTLLWSLATTAGNEGTDIFNTYPVPDIGVTGVFFVGVLTDNLIGEFPAPLDQSVPPLGHALLGGNTPPAGGYAGFDLSNPMANDVPPVDVSLIGLSGVWLLRALGSENGIGTSYCSSEPNSTGFAAEISANGSTSQAEQDLELVSTNAPGMQPGIFYFGPEAGSAAFGNGTRCINSGGGFSITRMMPVWESNGEFRSSFDWGTYGGELSVLPTVHFQCWYRDPAAGGGLFDLSDGTYVVFVP